ncbi:MAG: holo-ACP synthase [Rickettsiales bacterium]
MILGIGTDLTDINRIERTFKRYGEQFEERVFTVRERKKARARKNARNKTVAAFYAKRFAAKEACAKALGTGFRRGIQWREIEVVTASNGHPSLALHGAARKRLKELTPKGMTAKLHISISDEPPFAQAMVVIEAI